MDIYSLSSKSSTNSSSNSSSSDDDDFDKLSTNSASSDDTSSLKEEMKFYSEKIAALENKVEENNAILIRIDTKLDKLLNFNNPKEKENKNILNEMPPAYQIDHQEDLAINWRKNDEEEKENKNILHEISPATQIDDDKEAPINCFSALNWPERN
uniref:Uncharacterized protein n=1 Tax=Meloidogyne hapla TaxID=6305 RepID=A0A1I8B1T0_MELHA